MYALLQRVKGFAWPRGPNPVPGVSSRHNRYSASSFRTCDCLRELEIKAGLPKRDLFLIGKPTEIVVEPFGLVGRRYVIGSRSGDGMKNDLLKNGSVIGYIVETIGARCSCKFVAVLHVNKDCSGMYVSGVCPVCGVKSE